MRKMVVIGLTGGIGMGKSTAAKILKSFGLPIYSADKTVHDLLKKNGHAVKPVAKLFPESLKGGAIDRRIIGKSVFHHPEKLKRLEKILHPLVRAAERDFLRKARKSKARAAVLEIPLLFETGGEARCDFTICVTAPRTVQKQRVMERKSMTGARFKAILKRQMPDAQKRKLADHVVQTGKGIADTKRQLRAIMTGNQLD